MTYFVEVVSGQQPSRSANRPPSADTAEEKMGSTKWVVRLNVLCPAGLIAIAWPRPAGAVSVGAPVASPSSIPAGQPTLLTVTSQITPAAGEQVNSGGVLLLRLNA